MYSLRKIHRPADIADFLSKAEKSCGYILPDSYIENSEIYVLVYRWWIVGGFVFNNVNRVFTPDGGKWDVEISHVWMGDAHYVERSTLALKQGIATVVKEHGACRTEFLFRPGYELEAVTDIYHYEDQRHKPNPSTRDWLGLTTRWVRGNPGEIRHAELLVVKQQLTVEKVLLNLMLLGAIIVVSGAMSVDPEHSFRMTIGLVVNACRRVAFDLQSLSLTTIVVLGLLGIACASAAAFYMYCRFSSLMNGAVRKNQQRQAESAVLMTDWKPSRIPKLQAIKTGSADSGIVRAV